MCDNMYVMSVNFIEIYIQGILVNKLDKRMVVFEGDDHGGIILC